MKYLKKANNNKLITWVAIAIVLVVMCLLPFLLSGGWLSTVTEMLILALAGLALNLIVGYGGMVSFGHAGLYAVGAYAFALLQLRLGVPFPVAMILAPFISALIGAVVGWFCVRLTSHYFALLTMAFGMIIWAIINSWYSVTNGDNGLFGIPKPAMLNTIPGFYYFALIIVAVSAVVIKVILSSPYGVILRAIRENSTRVNFLGVNVRNYKWLTFTLSAFFMGIAGALFAGFTTSVFPQFAYWTKSGEFLVAVLLGGMFNFIGPMVGAVIFVFLDKVITTYTVYWPLVLGIILILCTITFRSGIVGFISEKVLKQGDR